jgi:acetoacetyl-CoA synthetase
MQKNALESIDLSTLKTIGSTGSPLSSQAFDWYFKQLPKVQMVSLSGGTDVCTAFVGGCPTKAVYSGEIQCASLGVDLKAFDETGTEVADALGELIVAKPMPSMPIYFWNDYQYKRYKSSYFEKFEGVWCHGDYIRITPRNGIVIYGRSDATLNKNGVRIGTAEIYNSLDEMSELDDALIVNIEREDGSSFMPLFVALKSELSESIKSAIKKQLKEKCSPRHLPDEIIRVAQIPYTISGKKMEVPVKKILMGIPKQKAATVDAMKNPSSLDDFESYYLNSLS